MTSRNLREVIERLQREGELLRISAPVSRDLEIPEIVDRVSKGPPEKNKALLFREGHRILDARGHQSFRQRATHGLGARCGSSGRTRATPGEGIRPAPAAGHGRAARARDGEAGRAARGRATAPGGGSCRPQEVIERETACLEALPILTCWPGEGGRFITLPQVITRDPESGTRNVLRPFIRFHLHVMIPLVGRVITGS